MGMGEGFQAWSHTSKGGWVSQGRGAVEPVWLGRDVSREGRAWKVRLESRARTGWEGRVQGLDPVRRRAVSVFYVEV